MLYSTRFLVPLLLAEVVGTAVMVAALALPSPAQPTTEGTAAHKSRFAGGKWQNGETLFGKNCASCHGPNLEGRCMAPSLLGVTRRMTDDAIVAHARRIGETMCSHGTSARSLTPSSPTSWPISTPWTATPK